MPSGDGYFDVSRIPFALHEMPITVREQVLSETARVTKRNSLLSLPTSHCLKRGLSAASSFCVTGSGNKYYREFIQSELDSLLLRAEIEMTETAKILGGAGKVLKGVNRREVTCTMCTASLAIDHQMQRGRLKPPLDCPVRLQG